MTGSELRSKVALILSQCKPDFLYFVPGAAKSVSGPKSSYSRSEPMVVLPGQAKLVNEQVPLLRIIYSQCNTPDLQRGFVELLRENVSVARGRVIAHVLADIHAIAHVPAKPQALEALWAGWMHRLTCASEHFTEADLIALGEAASGAWSSFPKKESDGQSVIQTDYNHDYRSLSHQLFAVGPLITLIRYERLKAQLVEGENPEINTDRGVLISRSAALGFPPELEQVLENIDFKLSTADSGFDYKACIGHIRTVFEKVFEHSAKVVAQTSGKPLTPNAQAGKFNETKGYLVSATLLTEKEGNAVQALYSFASEDGTHAFTSAPEQARVAKNCVIEWSLLVVGRVQQYVAAQKPASAVST